jgi:NADH-quinone oxidoreductase subunit A
MGQYLPLLALGVLATLFAVVSFAASRFLNPPKPTAAKVAPYECGIVDQTPPPERFPVKFFLVAMIFIVFDIEIIFLYPFAMIYDELGLFGLVDVIIFSATVFIPFTYLVSKGALDWGPLKLRRSSDIRVGQHRTIETTVRRVGQEGRSEGAPYREVA